MLKLFYHLVSKLFIQFSSFLEMRVNYGGGEGRLRSELWTVVRQMIRFVYNSFLYFPFSFWLYFSFCLHLWQMIRLVYHIVLSLFRYISVLSIFCLFFNPFCFCLCLSVSKFFKFSPIFCRRFFSLAPSSKWELIMEKAEGASA